jgi:hypothetical protein
MANGNPFYTHQPTPYVPQYVPQPIEQFAQAAGAVQGRYDTNIASKNQMDIMAANLELSPGDEWLREDMIAGIDTDLDEIIKSGRWQDASYLVPEVFKNRIGGNKGIIWSTKQAAEIAKFKDMYIQSGGDSGAYNFNPGDGFASVVRDPQTGELEYVPYNGDVEKRLDFDKKKEALFNQMPQLTNTTGVVDANNPALIKYVITQGISDGRMRRYLSEAFTRYKETGEYQQEKKALLSPQYGNKDGQMTEEMADQIILDSLYGVGREIVGVSTDVKYGKNPAAKAEDEGPKPSPFQTLPMPAVKNDKASNPYKLDDMDFDDKGEIKEQGSFMHSLRMALAAEAGSVGYVSESVKTKAIQKANKWFDDMRKEYPSLAGKSDKELYTIRSQADQKFNDYFGIMSVLGENYFPGSQGIFTQDGKALGDFTNRRMWIDGVEVGEDKSGLAGVIGKNNTESILKELKAMNPTGFTQVGSDPGAMVATVMVDGKPYNIEIANTNEVRNATVGSWTIANKVKNLEDGFAPLGIENSDGVVGFQVNTQLGISPDGSGGYGYTLIAVDRNGNEVPGYEGLTLENIITIEQNYLMSTGFVKSLK